MFPYLVREAVFNKQLEFHAKLARQ